MEKQLTAVDYLVEQLNNKFGNNDFLITFQSEIEQAKALEKQQIIDAYCEGLNEWNIKEDSAMKYYNNTFKQD